jgi:hypothetical protein
MKIVLIAILILIALFSIIYTYYGGFRKIDFVIAEQGGETLIYENLTGDYKQSPVIMDKIYYSLINSDKVETYKGFGIYYDNPKKVETSKLRSEIGCILEEKDSVKINDLKSKYNIKTFPKGSYIVTEFPSKGKISVIIGIFKVYPALTDYLKKQGYSEKGAVMEIYDTPNKKIVYRKEIIKE